MKNQEREDCGLYLGMEFYTSGTETEHWCWSCLQDLLALIWAAVAQGPNKHIIHMTNSSFCLGLRLHPHPHQTINIYGTLSKAVISFHQSDGFSPYPCPSSSTKKGTSGAMSSQAKWAPMQNLLWGQRTKHLSFWHVFLGYASEPQEEWVNVAQLVRLFVTPWTIESMEFSRPEYWSG